MDRVIAIVARVFDLRPEQVSDQTERGKLEVWDSLNHLLLISEIEEELNVEFTADEVLRIKNVKDLREILAKKQGVVLGA
jgi:acyl carrier protein